MATTTVQSPSSTSAKSVVPLKVGFFGESGSGKSTTAALLALGLSKDFHKGAPVYVFDTEPGWQFFKRIYAAEGVELVQVRQRSFDGMVTHLKEAQKAGACVYAVDSMTHTWTELMNSFANKSGRVQFEKFQYIKQLWNKWTVDFLNTPLHCLALGRLGWEYEYEPEDEDDPEGKKKLIKGDSKFKAGGGESFGYEPHLLVEMQLGRANSDSGRGGSLVHYMTVLKDRAMVMNGKECEFHDFLTGYQPDGYKTVLRAFMPHINEMQMLEGHPTLDSATSSALVPKSDSYIRDKKRRDFLIEETFGSLNKLWPGQTGENIKLRTSVGDALFGVKSKVGLEQIALDAFEIGFAALMGFEKYMAETETKPMTEADILAQVKANLALAKEELAKAPERDTSHDVF